MEESEAYALMKEAHESQSQQSFVHAANNTESIQFYNKFLQCETSGSHGSEFEVEIHDERDEGFHLSSSCFFKINLCS
jgi:hypothetical protein